jgi:hypothetical protein
MKSIINTIAIILILCSATVNAQTKFTLNTNTETAVNTVTLNTIGAEGNELKFERDANGASVKWQTTGESNTSQFELQLSYDNENFETSKIVAASDVTSWVTNYEVRYRKTYLSGVKVYYRIKTVFNNGAETYTNATAFALTIGHEINYASIH